MPFASLHTNSFICSLRGALAALLASLLVVALVPEGAQAQTPDAAQETFVDRWMGTLEIGGSDLRVFFHIERDDDGSLTAFTFSPDAFGNPRIPVSHVATEGDSLTIEVNAIGGRFAGRLMADESIIEGTWTQQGQSVPLALSPADDSIAASVPQPPETQRPEADPADVKSPEAIVEASFESISFPAGGQPDWDRFRSLFLPEARLIQTGGGPGTKSFNGAGSVEEYIETASLGRGEGFHEETVHTVTERYGDIAHVFITYEGSQSDNASEPSFRGMETAQLWYDGDRWWIVNLMWQAEREGAPIPERYEGGQ